MVLGGLLSVNNNNNNNNNKKKKKKKKKAAGKIFSHSLHLYTRHAPLLYYSIS